MIELKPFADATINTNTLLVWYIKQPLVDLLPRIERFIDASERTVVIKIRDAEAPLGKHQILFQVEDSYEQLNEEVFEFEVVNPG